MTVKKPSASAVAVTSILVLFSWVASYMVTIGIQEHRHGRLDKSDRIIGNRIAVERARKSDAWKDSVSNWGAGVESEGKYFAIGYSYFVIDTTNAHAQVWYVWYDAYGRRLMRCLSLDSALTDTIYYIPSTVGAYDPVTGEFTSGAD